MEERPGVVEAGLQYEAAQADAHAFTKDAAEMAGRQVRGGGDVIDREVPVEMFIDEPDDLLEPLVRRFRAPCASSALGKRSGQTAKG